MSWGPLTKQKYEILLRGPMGKAFLGSRLDRRDLMTRIRKLEQGAATALDMGYLEGQGYLTPGQARELWLLRSALCLFLERHQVWPWRLRNRPVSMLYPLLNFGWQGLMPRTGGTIPLRYVMHGAWDLQPVRRARDALQTRAALVMAGIPCSTERDMVLALIQSKRDQGWWHTGSFQEYGTIQPVDAWGPERTYAYEDIRSVKHGDCHIATGYLGLQLRGFNIAAHPGPRWPIVDRPDPSNPPPVSYSLFHLEGHCYLHLPGIGAWLSHGDDVWDRLLRTIHAACSLKSETWAGFNLLNTSQYASRRAADRLEHLYWCLLVGTSAIDTLYDVSYLHGTGQLKSRLEDIHLDNGYQNMQGAPAPASIQPVFNQEEVQFLLDWVGAKLS